MCLIDSPLRDEVAMHWSLTCEPHLAVIPGLTLRSSPGDKVEDDDGQ